MKARNIVWIIVVVLVVGAGAAFALGLFKPSAAAQATANASQTVAVTRGPLAAIVGATGTVRSNQNATLTWQTSGKVAAVSVQIGDTVTADQQIAALDPTTWSQNILQAQSDLINAKQALQDLYNNTGTNGAQAQSDLVAAQKEFDDATTNRQSLNYPRGTQNMIDQAESDLTLAQNQLSIAQSNFNQVSSKPQNDPVRAQAVLNLTNANNKVLTAQANLNWYRGKPSTADLAAADARLSLAKSRLADAQRKVDSLTNGPSANDVAVAQNRVTMAQAVLNQPYIKAPFGGTITDMSMLAGDMVNPNTYAARIDDLSRLFIDLQVSEVDINRIQVGQTVSLTFDAIADKKYNGQVTRVGAVGTTTGGVVYFPVVVQLTDADASVKPGMTAAANVTVTEVKDTLMVPSRAVRALNGDKVVYISDGKGGSTAVVVTIGMASDTLTQILSGNLKEGDLVQLNPTISSLSGVRGAFGGGPAAGGTSAPAGGN